MIAVAGISFAADPAGALYWPEENLLAVADLHLEKGSSFAARGVLLPPYDTAATLQRLALLLAQYAPRVVVALGDSFHDGRGPNRLADTDRANLRALQRGRDWIWIAGNHDPDPADGIGGRFLPEFKLGGLTFRHEPTGVAGGGDPPSLRFGGRASKPAIALAAAGEIAGHLHPVARVSRRGRAVSRRCFAGDAERVVMPAFGAYAGGLNVRDRAFTRVFATLAFTAHMLGDRRVYPVAAKHCLPD